MYLLITIEQYESKATIAADFKINLRFNFKFIINFTIIMVVIIFINSIIYFN